MAGCILLVEDDAAQAELSLLVLEQLKIANPLEVAESGAAALARVRGEPPFQGAPRPDLILLDLNLPGLSGIEVLEQLAADPRAADIPVVALSASEPRRSEAEALRRLGKTWVKKPLGMPELLQIVGSVDSLGLAVVKLPAR